MKIKGKYKYNPVTLTYDKIELSFKRWISRLFTQMAFSSVMGLVLMFAYFYLFESPLEKQLRTENDDLRYNYESLNERLEQVALVLTDIQDRDDNIYRTVFEADPIPNSIRKAGFGGVNRYTELENKPNMEIVIETTKILDVLSKQIYVQSKSFDDIINLATHKSEMLKRIPAIQPLRNKDMNRIASGFGYRIHPIYKTLRMHTGVDLSAATGAPIFATGDGVIEVADFGRGYGKRVVIDHGYSYKTQYAHMSRILVKKGQAVKRGDMIGLVGNTGTSTGSHLHYEVIKNDKYVDPINYYMNDLTPEEYDAMIEVASRPNQSFD